MYRLWSGCELYVEDNLEVGDNDMKSLHLNNDFVVVLHRTLACVLIRSLLLCVVVVLVAAFTVVVEAVAASEAGILMCDLGWDCRDDLWVCLFHVCCSKYLIYVNLETLWVDDVCDRAALEDIKVELQERTQRWKKIEKVCGFNVIMNPGIPYLNSILCRSSGQQFSLLSCLSHLNWLYLHRCRMVEVWGPIFEKSEADLRKILGSF